MSRQLPAKHARRLFEKSGFGKRAVFGANYRYFSCYFEQFAMGIRSQGSRAMSELDVDAPLMQSLDPDLLLPR